MTDVAAARRIIDIVTGTWQAQALHAAAELSLADHVQDGHTTPEALAERTGADPDGVVRLLRLLGAMGVFAGDEKTGYRLTAVGTLLRADHSRSMRELVRVYGAEFHRAWGSVVDAVRTGHSGFEHAHGASIHTYLREQPGAGPRFQRAMNAGNVFFPGVPEAYDFSGCHTVVDLAGGSGMLLSVVLRAHPELRGILLDLPHVLPVARAHLDTAVGPDRYEAVGGDLFDTVPAGADAYLLSRVLQDWDDARCVDLLRTVRTAMPDSGRLLIVERVIDTEGRTLLPVLWDLHLLMAAGGRERTLDGYTALLDESGLRLESVHPLALETSLLVAAPAPGR